MLPRPRSDWFARADFNATAEKATEKAKAMERVALDERTEGSIRQRSLFRKNLSDDLMWGAKVTSPLSQ